MHFYSLTIFILINAGISIGICRSKLTEGFRNKVSSLSSIAGKWVTCVMCFGFATPLIVYPYVYHAFDIYDVPGFMFIGSFTSYFLNRISNIMQIS